MEIEMIRTVAIMFLLVAFLLGWTAALWNVSGLFSASQPYGISDTEISGSLFRELGSRRSWQIQVYVPIENSLFKEEFLDSLVDSDGPLSSLIANHVDLILKTVPPDAKNLQDKGLVRIWSKSDFVAEIVFSLKQQYLSQSLGLKISDAIRAYRNKGEKNG